MKKNSPIIALFLSVLLAGCSSAPPVKTQDYATLQSSRIFEYEFSTVWKAIEVAFKDYKIEERDPAKVDALELKKLTRRSLETDWVYGQSRDKYQEYRINDSPRKKYLQTRVKFEVIATSVMGGVGVEVRPEEDIEKLASDGSSLGYSAVETPDSSRADEILNKINQAILSAAP
ncbi:MAG TPA: hypothetical protein DCS07_10485 [Bdellovibrionales bacterium]|nr:MAG: hypothetical protein A2Z97_08835 [Bdellovibrionales bacterium GWB1_52_6]OFZ03968.1 MAG: hypothetical protein A2X97_08530 [Bdellovibrionales bacterium GWA1_52_35]HAR43037.1 hypothetical protein [Bdellovibrionales bacterium]HCM39781.1 hypothetical protein [Bdellovibrionales bacterium]